MRHPLIGRRARGAAAVVLICAVVGFGSPANGAASWTIVASPNPVGSTGSYLNGVSCTSATNCFAVGYFTTASNPGKTLIERWNGTKWLVVAGANATGSLGSYLNGVSCTSTTSCAAVGYSYDSKATKTLAARWNGTKWSVVATPNPAGDESDLLGVSCAGTSCIAVGYYNSTTGSDRTLTERWNGTKWAIVASPNPAGSDSYFNGVSCAGASYCVAVGDSFAAGPGETLVERWNGTSWAIVPSPSITGSDSYLNGVRCTSTTNCVAVGFYTSTSDTTLAERWNGTKWSAAVTPNPTGSTASYLNGVSCVSATACFAVGSGRTTGSPRTLVERG